jgi:hypothetical protein
MPCSVTLDIITDREIHKEKRFVAEHDSRTTISMHSKEQ